jgi:hypothetical protein
VAKKMSDLMNIDGVDNDVTWEWKISTVLSWKGVAMESWVRSFGRPSPGVLGFAPLPEEKT